MNQVKRLSKTDQLIEAEKQNYIINYANLVADNIASRYKIYENKMKTPLKYVLRSSEDTFTINEEEKTRILNLIYNRLRKKYNLKLTSLNIEDNIIIEEINNFCDK